MNALNLIEGLKIIEEYRPEKESVYHVRSEHDVIYAGSLEWPINSKDKKKLLDMGWEEDEDADGYRI